MKRIDWLTRIGDTLNRTLRPPRRRLLHKSFFAVEMLEVRTLLSAPTFSPTSYDYSVDEDAETGDVLGTLSATDDDGDPLEYSIVDGDPEGVFDVDSSGQVTVMGQLDYETTTAYALTVEVSDGTETDTATINVTVNDVAEAPVFNPAIYNWAVDEDADEATVLGTLSAGDPQGDELTYIIVDGDPEGVFDVDATGQLVVTGELDYETTAAYTLTVEVSDGTEIDTATVNVVVNDVTEAPVMDQTSYTFNVNEDANVSTSLGAVSATDPQGDEITYSILSGNEEGMFWIDETTGDIMIAEELDYETTSVYTLTVMASDGTHSDTATVTINVLNVNEAPVITYFEAMDDGNGDWTFVGTIEDDDGISPGMMITFGGILEGHSVFVNADGTFSYTVSDPGEGTVTAQTTDTGGLASNTAFDWVDYS